MKHFVPIYLSTALISTAAVYWIAPRFASEEEPEAVQEPAAPSSDRTETPSSAKTERGNSSASDTFFEPPAYLGICVAKKNEASTWGIVMKETPYYAENGTSQGKMKGGELFHFKKIVSSSKGDMAVCQFVNRKENAETLYLIKKGDALLFTGEYKKLHPKQLDALQRYYLLRGQVAAKRDLILVNAAEKNPHFREYQRLYKEYTALVEEAKKLEQIQNQSTGLAREKAMDQLRALRVKEAPISKQYAEIRQKYNEWKTANVDVDKLVNRNIDIVRWRSEMDALRDTIPGLTL